MTNHKNFDALSTIVSIDGGVGKYFHIYITGNIPNIVDFQHIDSAKWEKFKNRIKKRYNWKAEHEIEWNIESYKFEMRNVYCVYLEPGVTIQYDSDSGIRLMYDFESDSDILEDLKKEIGDLKLTHSNSRIGFVLSEFGSLSIRFKKFKPFENDLTKYLGDEVTHFKKEITNRIQQKNQSGLFLLYGKPGTGKTSFIKSVISEVEKDAIFITPSFTESLASPELIGLLMNHQDSILIIEDAETVLMKRQADNSNAVSNLLNLTDGFPADFLNLNIICTFNTDIDNIDPALLREGRLSGIKEFKKLQPDQANILAKEIGYELNTNLPMTLAEVCNGKTNKHKIATNGIGF